jgi:hypothetical protein
MTLVTCPLATSSLALDRAGKHKVKVAITQTGSEGAARGLVPRRRQGDQHPFFPKILKSQRQAAPRPWVRSHPTPIEVTGQVAQYHLRAGLEGDDAGRPPHRRVGR